MSLTEQEMQRAAYELVSCAMLDGMCSPEYREAKEGPARQKFIWQFVANAVSQSEIPLANLLQAVFDCTNTQLRPGAGSRDVPSADPVQHPWGGAF